MFRFLPYGTIIKKITTDVNNIKSGMIFINLDSNNIDSIYKAYNEGANLIITEQNVNDLLLPLVKVKDIGEAYLKLLDSIYGKPLEKVSFIPIYGGSRGNIVSKILESAFKKCFFEFKQRNKLFDFSNLEILPRCNFYVEEFFYYILNQIERNITIIPIPYDNNMSSLESIIQNNSECAIIVECDSIDKKNISRAKPGRLVIINIDEPYALTMVNDKNDNVIITYGLSKKAAVTATSIDYGERTNFNYCLQRTFCSREGKIIEPFETPLSIKGLGINRIYAALASISCALYYDVDMAFIKEALVEYSDRGRDFLIKQYEEFTLVDNFCSTIADYKETFEMIQFLDYENLYIIIPAKPTFIEQFDNSIIEIINESAINLNIKEIMFISCSNSTNSEKPNDFLQQLEHLAKNLNFNINYFNQLTCALRYAKNIISKGDVLLTLGGNEMDTSNTIIELLISN